MDTTIVHWGDIGYTPKDNASYKSISGLYYVGYSGKENGSYHSRHVWQMVALRCTWRPCTASRMESQTDSRECEIDFRAKV